MLNTGFISFAVSVWSNYCQFEGLVDALFSTMYIVYCQVSSVKCQLFIEHYQIDYLDYEKSRKNKLMVVKIISNI